MPAAEVAHLTEAYGNARVILEYGSGASTRIAAAMRGKYILSVESDRQWARGLRSDIMAARSLSQVVVYHVDVGPTGPWGRVIDDREWRTFHRYPNAVWHEPFFRHPDVVLIDGRFRTACFVSTMMHIKRPVTVLFDDYVGRPKYRMIERLAEPESIIGRMAQFRMEPGQLRPQDVGFAIEQFFHVIEHGRGAAAYNVE